MALAIDLSEVTYALSYALDLVGVKVVQHGKRVAYMAAECARTHGFSPGEGEELFRAALLHDAGVSSTEVHWHLISELDWEHSEEHCRTGYELLKGFPPFRRLAELVLYHHTHWRASEALAHPVRLSANCIFLADRVDALIKQHQPEDVLLARKAIRQEISSLSGEFFAPSLVEAFMQTSLPEAFWLMLEPHHLEYYIRERVSQSRRQTIDMPQLKALAAMFAKIVDAKSGFTAEHSAGVARLARYLGELHGLPAEECEMLEIAGLLHDLGKLRVPDRILEKPAALDDEEYATIQRHTFETYQILRRIEVFHQAAKWAGYHHEAPSGEGYPFHRHDAELPLQARILAVADVFQALAQTRPYRASLSREKILAILRSKAEEGRLDAGLVKSVGEHLPQCWQAATQGN